LNEILASRRAFCCGSRGRRRPTNLNEDLVFIYGKRVTALRYHHTNAPGRGVVIPGGAPKKRAVPETSSAAALRF
jgi:hypothetical protein